MRALTGRAEGESQGSVGKGEPRSRARELVELEPSSNGVGRQCSRPLSRWPQIRDSRLYREAGFATFETYCRERWGFSRSRAYQLVDFALVMRQIPVENEPQARRIAPALRAGGAHTLLQAHQRRVKRDGALTPVRACPETAPRWDPNHA